jgi:hypothetical protein
MPVLKAARFTLLALTVLLAVSAGSAGAAVRMPIGFFDDPSFRWSADRAANLQAAAADGASVIHTTANWATLAPTKPANAADGADPAYKLSDLDELVSNAGLNGLRVMIDITATPKWANGNKTPNHLPTRLSDLTTFAHMLASRYNGSSGHGSVALWAVWNEPNIELFLTPQFSGSKIVGPANYAKLYKAAYAGIKSGNPAAKVAIGETSARGRDKPLKGVSGSVAPGTFAKLLAQQKGLKFDAWAHHPYPTAPNLPPLQLVKYPNVTLSTLPKFESDLKKYFHRSVPIWITEYGHETKPAEPHGVTTSVQAKYAAQALTIARNDPNVQMFIWFTLRDNSGNPWQSGLLGSSGAPKPAYSTFGSLAKLIDGIQTTVKAGSAPTVALYFPYLSYWVGPGSPIGTNYVVKDGAKILANAQPTMTLAADQALRIPLAFTPVKGHYYIVTVRAGDANGHTETRSATLLAQ